MGSRQGSMAEKERTLKAQSQEWPCEHTMPRWNQKGGPQGWETQRRGGGKVHRWSTSPAIPAKHLRETLWETLRGPRAWFGRLKAPSQADEGGLSPTRNRELAEPTAL